MNKAIWCGALAWSVIVFFSWRNLLVARRTRAKRNVAASVFWLISAAALPIPTYLIDPDPALWVWLLVAFGTNGFLMMGVDALLFDKEHAHPS